MLYRARIVQPYANGSCRVLIPQVFGDSLVTVTRFGSANLPLTPGLGWVSFEGSEFSYPIWVGADPTIELPQSAQMITQTGEAVASSSLSPTATGTVGDDIPGLSVSITLASTDVLMVWGTLDISYGVSGLNTTTVGELVVNGTAQPAQILYRVLVGSGSSRGTVGQTWQVTGVSGTVTVKMTARMTPTANINVSISDQHSTFRYMVLSPA